MIETLGPYTIAVASLFGTLFFIVVSRRNSIASQEQIIQLTNSVKELKEQNLSLNRIGHEAGVSNQLRGKQIFGTKALVQESMEQNKLLDISNTRRNELVMSQFLPDLAIKEIDPLKLYFTNENTVVPYRFNTYENFDSPNIFIDILNIGFAAAKNVEVNWKFEVSTCVKYIKKFDSSASYDISIEDSGMSIFNKSTKGILYSKLDCLSSTSINFILPASTLHEPVKCYLPLDYLTLYKIFLTTAASHFAKDKKNLFMEFDMNLYPKLQVELSYKDLIDKARKQEYEIKFSPTNFTKMLDINIEEPISNIYVEIKTKDAS